MIAINPEYSIAPLVVATIEAAAAAARRGNCDALDWLQVEGIHWASAIGCEIDQIINRWIANGCKPPRSRRGIKQPGRHKSGNRQQVAI